MKEKIHQTFPEILPFDITTIKYVDDSKAKRQCSILKSDDTCIILAYTALWGKTQVRKNFRKHFIPSRRIKNLT